MGGAIRKSLVNGPFSSKPMMKAWGDTSGIFQIYDPQSTPFPAPLHGDDHHPHHTMVVPGIKRLVHLGKPMMV